MCLAVALNGFKGTAGCDKGPAAGPFEQVSRCRLGLRRRVGKRKDDRPVGVGGHLADTRLRKSPRSPGDPDQHGWSGVADDVGEGDGSGDIPAAQLLGPVDQPLFGRGQVASAFVDEAFAVDDVETRAGIGLAHAIPHQRSGELGTDADAGRPGPRQDEALLRKLAAAAGHPRQNGAGRDRRRALDVVVETAQPVAVALEDRLGVAGGEVLPLQQHVGKALHDRMDEELDEVVVLAAPDALAPPADVGGIVEALLVVRAHVEQDGQRPGGIDAAAERVERQLADGNAHAAGALVSQAEDALPVGDNDDLDLPAHIGEDRLHLVALRVRDEQAPRPPVDVAELLARLPHDGRVDDGHHLIDVFQQQPVEERLVLVLELAKIDMLLQVGRLGTECLVAAGDLVLDRLDLWWQEPQHAQLAPLLERERRALVQQRCVDERSSRPLDGNGVRGCVGGGHGIRRRSRSTSGIILPGVLSQP